MQRQDKGFSLKEDVRTCARDLLVNAQGLFSVGQMLVEVHPQICTPFPNTPYNSTINNHHSIDVALRRVFPTKDELLSVISNLIRAGFEWAAYGRMAIALYVNFVTDTLAYGRCRFGVDDSLAGAIFETSATPPVPSFGKLPETWPALLERHGVPVFQVTSAVANRLTLDPHSRFPTSAPALMKLMDECRILRENGEVEHTVRR